MQVSSHCFQQSLGLVCMMATQLGWDWFGINSKSYFFVFFSLKRKSLSCSDFWERDQKLSIKVRSSINSVNVVFLLAQSQRTQLEVASVSRTDMGSWNIQNHGLLFSTARNSPRWKTNLLLRWPVNSTQVFFRTAQSKNYIVWGGAMNYLHFLTSISAKVGCCYSGVFAFKDWVN